MRTRLLKILSPLQHLIHTIYQHACHDWVIRETSIIQAFANFGDHVKAFLSGYVDCFAGPAGQGESANAIFGEIKRVRDLGFDVDGRLEGI